VYPTGCYLRIKKNKVERSIGVLISPYIVFGLLVMMKALEIELQSRDRCIHALNMSVIGYNADYCNISCHDGTI